MQTGEVEEETQTNRERAPPPPPLSMFVSVAVTLSLLEKLALSPAAPQERPTQPGKQNTRSPRKPTATVTVTFLIAFPMRPKMPETNKDYTQFEKEKQKKKGRLKETDLRACMLLARLK